MTLEQLRMFVAVAERGHLSKAAFEREEEQLLDLLYES